MSFTVEEHVLARLAAAPLRREPFAHCVVDGIFPAEFFEAIVDHWPQEDSWQPIAQTGRVSRGAYRARLIVPMSEAGWRRLDSARRRFWECEVGRWLLGRRFREAVLAKFATELAGTPFAATPEETEADALLVSDRTHYAIGPHTDAPHRVVSLLFYLPEDDAFRRYGTSLYAPLDPTMRCRGGPHHRFELFRRVATVDFLPNRMLAFPKSDRCFHGVEPVDLPGIDRRLLIYDVRRRTSATRASGSSQSP